MNNNPSNDNLILENEKMLISWLINDNSASDEILVRLDTKDLSEEKHRIIFNTVKEMKEHHEDISFQLISQKIKESNDIEDKLNVLKIIYDVAAEYPVVENLQSHILIQINWSTKKKLNNLATEILNKNDLNFSNCEEYFSNVQDELIDTINSRSLDKIKFLSYYIDGFNEKLERMKKYQNQLTGTTSGFQDIDKITNGFQNGDLIILAARPSIGKTALALNFLLNASYALNVAENEVVVMFSLEMGIDQLIQRMLCTLSGVKINELRSGSWDYQTESLIYSGLNKLNSLNIMIEEKSSVTILDIQATLKQIIKTHKIKLVVIDYLQLIESTSKNTNRVVEVGKISRTLKILAKDLQVPIIAIAQLSRKIEERKAEDRKPMLSDLRESGSIEQDADIVSFIDYENEFDSRKPASIENNGRYKTSVIVNFYIEKHRNGQTGLVKLIFDKEKGKYHDYTNDIN